MEDIKYSIIIPVYNLSIYIESTLKALFKTGLNLCEVIIIDDGSSDDTIERVKCFFEDHDFADYCILKQQNSGVSKARNRGIDVAKGDYLIFFDGDDSCDVDIIKKISEACTDKTDILVWRYYIVDGERKCVSQELFDTHIYSANAFLEHLLQGSCRMRIGSFAVKRNIVVDNGLRFTEGCSICEDVEFMYKCVITAESIYAINEPLYEYNKREGSAANTYDLRRFQAPVAVRRIYEYATKNNSQELSEYVLDGLKNGLLITHAMYSFDSCCKYIKGIKQFREFIKVYKSQYCDVEKLVKEAVSDAKFSPCVFSKKRLKLFEFNRCLYAFIMCIK